jgi:uncharacterized membrane protein
MNETNRIDEPTLRRDRDVFAAVMSIIPGLGHVYKGHYAAGFLTMFLGVPLCLWIGVLLSLATAGIGLLLPLLLWAMVVIDAYYKKDFRKHHPLGVL